LFADASPKRQKFIPQNLPLFRGQPISSLHSGFVETRAACIVARRIRNAIINGYEWIFSILSGIESCKRSRADREALLGV
jgi:hypothetical protein